MSFSSWLSHHVFKLGLLSGAAATTAIGCFSTADAPGESAGSSTSAIVGGSNVTDIHAYPWTAVLKTSDFAQWWDETAEVPSGFWCTAVVIGSRYVLTDAHCVTTADAQGNLTVVRTPDQILIGIGKNKLSLLSDTADDHNTFAVDRIWVHPQWGACNEAADVCDHDIALLRLTAPSPLGSIRMDGIGHGGRSAAQPGKRVRVLGWGDVIAKIDGTEPNLWPDQLKQTQMTLISQSDCVAKYSPLGVPIDPTLLCARQDGPTQEGTCYGDSGGPVVAESEDGPVLVGMGEGGHGCADPRYPDVYTRVAPLAGWVEQCRTRASCPEYADP